MLNFHSLLFTLLFFVKFQFQPSGVHVIQVDGANDSDSDDDDDDDDEDEDDDDRKDKLKEELEEEAYEVRC